MSSHDRIDENKSIALIILVDQIAIEQIRRHPHKVCFDCEVDPDVRFEGDVSQLESLLDSLISRALGEMDGDGELSISAFDNAKGLEIEIADTGPPCESRSQSPLLAAAALKANLAWMNCPQGGAAVTVTLPRKLGSQRMAA